MDRVSIGIPVYGSQSKDWWGPFVKQAAELYKQNIELVELHIASSMMTDVNRNHIVDDFLKTDSEWLRWLDADNVDKLGSTRRLLDTRKSLVSGVYVKRIEKGGNVAYFKTDDGASYKEVVGYTPGEIFPVDAAGLGGCLVHRRVFEDIKRDHFMFNIDGGGIVTVHKDDIEGDVFDGATDEHDGKLIDGVLRLRLNQSKGSRPFAFYVLGFGRTEDYGFFEMAKRSGHQLWLDTGVEIGHLGEKIYTPADIREKELQELRMK
jgi:hypothetical protein